MRESGDALPASEQAGNGRRTSGGDPDISVTGGDGGAGAARLQINKGQGEDKVFTFDNVFDWSST